MISKPKFLRKIISNFKMKINGQIELNIEKVDIKTFPSKNSVK